jgi:NADH:ubiquinone oxidoreductase subunit H
VILKAIGIFTLVALLRGVYPRLTIEKVLDLGWKYLIPLGLDQPDYYGGFLQPGWATIIRL